MFLPHCRFCSSTMGEVSRFAGRRGQGIVKSGKGIIHMPITPQDFVSNKKLDDAVFAAYGWKSDLSNEEILERLLALNLERAKK